MNLKMLKENYVTRRVVYINFSKYESIMDVDIVNDTISILELLQMMENESNLSIDDKGTITCRDMLNLSIVSDDNRLFMFTFDNISPKIYFVSAKSYDEAYYISLKNDVRPCLTTTFKMVHQLNSYNIFVPCLYN